MNTTIKPNLRTKITRYISNVKYNREQKNINKYLDLNDNIGADAYNQLYSAKKTIANYAKNNDVRIKISQGTPADVLCDFLRGGGTPRDQFSIWLQIFNRNTGMKAQGVVSPKTNKLFPKISRKNVMIHNVETGTQRNASVTSFTQDTFLRNVYRKIEELTNKVKKCY